MAHFAELDPNNKVVRVLVVDNSDILDSEKKESEQVGVEYLTKIFGYSNWKQTSYNDNFRKHYAGVGYTYDEKLDAFIPPSPYPSWTLNKDTCLWEAPTSCPTDNKTYVWDEESKTWKEILDYLIEEASK